MNGSSTLLARSSQASIHPTLFFSSNHHPTEQSQDIFSSPCSDSNPPPSLFQTGETFVDRVGACQVYIDQIATYYREHVGLTFTVTKYEGATYYVSIDTARYNPYLNLEDRCEENNRRLRLYLCACWEEIQNGLQGAGVNIELSQLTVKNLVISGSFLLTGKKYPTLEEIKEQLTVLDMSGTLASDGTLAYLYRFPRLKSLFLDSCPNISKRGDAFFLKGHNTLENLSIRNTSIKVVDPMTFFNAIECHFPKLKSVAFSLSEKHTFRIPGVDRQEYCHIQAKKVEKAWMITPLDVDGKPLIKTIYLKEMHCRFTKLYSNLYKKYLQYMKKTESPTTVPLEACSPPARLDLLSATV